VIESQRTKQLLALDRYERRAQSQRKFAIREFDAARRKDHEKSGFTRNIILPLVVLAERSQIH